MKQTDLKARAQRVLSRLNALGVTKDGKPLVIDQVYELVAAEEGFRNQHALRAHLKQSQPAQPNGKGFVQIPRILDQGFAKALLVQHSIDDSDEAHACEAWELILAESDGRFGADLRASEDELRLRDALQWATSTLSNVLAGKPVRDADEVLSYAKGLLNAGKADQACAPVAHAASCPEVTTSAVRRWLLWLEAALRMAGVCEADLDDLVHDCLDGHSASSVNNQGLAAQLQTLFEHRGGVAHWSEEARRAFVQLLESAVEGLTLSMPESGASAPRQALRAQVSIHVGSPLEESLVVDTLEWFAQASAADIERLLADGLSNSQASEEVILWLAANSIDPQMRTNLNQLLERMAARQAQHPELVGLTAAVDPHGVERFLNAVLRHQAR